MYNKEKSFGKRAWEATRQTALVIGGLGIALVGIAGGVTFAAYELFMTPQPSLANVAVGLAGFLLIPGIAGKAGLEGTTALLENK